VVVATVRLKQLLVSIIMFIIESRKLCIRVGRVPSDAYASFDYKLMSVLMIGFSQVRVYINYKCVRPAYACTTKLACYVQRADIRLRGRGERATYPRDRC
jgi:hypothetical protein